MFCWSRQKHYTLKLKRKVVVVGDCHSGKSCLEQAIAGKIWTDMSMVSTWDENYVEIESREQKVELELFE
ncbi:unnamed protein product [Rotaria sp. Silwood1]|nr:unnamed protein product [Rotaria sp. Silwood1]CAF1325097.1 unnamed protein product [Rotaria sp. Silwood1]